MQDWAAGDTSWGTDKGKGIVGAIKYLSAMGMHTLSVPTLTLGTDDANVFPYVDATDRTRFDCSKLDQWQIIFETAQRKGLFIELKTQLAANQTVLDNGTLEPERKLYYRELVARFGQNVSLAWNLGEYNTQTTAQQKEMVAWFAKIDPYFIQPTGQRPVTIGAAPGSETAVFTPLMNDSSRFNSFTISPLLNEVHAKTVEWVNATRVTDKKMIIFCTIQNPRTGGYSVETKITGGEIASIGNPPSDPAEDWAVCIIDKEVNTRIKKRITKSGISALRLVQTIMTRDGRITMALPVMKKSDIVEIVRCDGRLVAALATKAAKLQCRLPVRGMYLVCVNSGGVRALLGRVMYL